MRYKQTNDRTKEHFSKIFDCNNHFNSKERDTSKDDENIKSMLSAFGKNKLSVNRYTKCGDPIMLYIYRMDKCRMFIGFWNEFNKKITDKTRRNFIKVFMSYDYLEYAMSLFEDNDTINMSMEIKEAMSLIFYINKDMKKKENEFSTEEIKELIFLEDIESSEETFHDFIKSSYSKYEADTILNNRKEYPKENVSIKKKRL